MIRYLSLFAGLLTLMSFDNHEKRVDNKSKISGQCVVTDSVVNSIVNQVIIDFNCWNENYKEKVLLDKNLLPIGLADYRKFLFDVSEKGFDTSDSTNMLAEINKILECKYDPKYINALVIPTDTVVNWIKQRIDYRKKFREKYKSGVMVIDKPMINRKTNEAIVQITYSLGGMEGKSELWIYQLTNKKWIKHELIRKIIS